MSIYFYTAAVDYPLSRRERERERDRDLIYSNTSVPLPTLSKALIVSIVPLITINYDAIPQKLN